MTDGFGILPENLACDVKQKTESLSKISRHSCTPELTRTVAKFTNDRHSCKACGSTASHCQICNFATNQEDNPKSAPDAQANVRDVRVVSIKMSLVFFSRVSFFDGFSQ